jgi:hypothetical protein
MEGLAVEPPVLPASDQQRKRKARTDFRSETNQQASRECDVVL